ncbi:DoxX family protein [Yinghuangia sp. ASG 101]|uniref:DoxX family protein n=1 Tax=Yinghuangia sp. ASG 101 TaxID=2896848 RepID=UPI001E63F66A|nr:DoxX family protein [Yinghuangia sp. ASG 101]UGQ12472.1 DoxX family protein [Yinghuangia sp. ASG 101]
MHAFDTTLLIVRLTVGLTMVAHGWNHAFGGGRLAGTAGWFEGLGLRPGRVHALMSVLVETGCGIAFAAGFLTPAAAGALLGTMIVAGVIEHRTHGFFVFRNGVEYVLMIGLVLIAVAVSGGGAASVDEAADLHLGAWAGFAVCAGIGVGGSVLLLAACWRPGRATAPTP